MRNEVTTKINEEKMVLTIGHNFQTMFATVQTEDSSEEYEMSYSVCPDPTCGCGTMTLDLTPVQSEINEMEIKAHKNLKCDINERTIGFKNKKMVPQQEIDFAKRLLNEFDENDFQLLTKVHFDLKNKLTEEAKPESINAIFDYDDIDYNGLMIGYNDLLPYGDALHLKFMDKNCIIIDQYCVLPGCSCTNAFFDIYPVGKRNEAEELLCAVSFNYQEKVWKFTEDCSLLIDIDTIKVGFKEQLPELYQLIPARHKKLKSIYANCKQKQKPQNLTEQGNQAPKIGRNDPCPCGSGKKHKKCCGK